MRDPDSRTHTGARTTAYIRELARTRTRNRAPTRTNTHGRAHDRRTTVRWVHAHTRACTHTYITPLPPRRARARDHHGRRHRAFAQSVGAGARAAVAGGRVERAHYPGGVAERRLASGHPEAAQSPSERWPSEPFAAQHASRPRRRRSIRPTVCTRRVHRVYRVRLQCAQRASQCGVRCVYTRASEHHLCRRPMVQHHGRVHHHRRRAAQVVVVD